MVINSQTYTHYFWWRKNEEEYLKSYLQVQQGNMHQVKVFLREIQTHGMLQMVSQR
jgi:hypothetical protein